MVQVPVPAIIVTIPPLMVHTPLLAGSTVSVTGRPELEAAATGKVAPRGAPGGAPVLDVMVWWALMAFPLMLTVWVDPGLFKESPVKVTVPGRLGPTEEGEN